MLPLAPGLDNSLMGSLHIDNYKTNKLVSTVYKIPISRILLKTKIPRNHQVVY